MLKKCVYLLAARNRCLCAGSCDRKRRRRVCEPCRFPQGEAFAERNRQSAVEDISAGGCIHGINSKTGNRGIAVPVTDSAAHFAQLQNGARRPLLHQLRANLGRIESPPTLHRATRLPPSDSA